MDTIHTLWSDGLRVAGGVDLLLFNPPYVPTEDSEVQHSPLHSTWAGGVQGRRVMDEFLMRVPVLNQPLSMH